MVSMDLRYWAEKIWVINMSIHATAWMKGGTGVTGAGEDRAMVLCPIIMKEGR